MSKKSQIEFNCISDNCDSLVLFSMSDIEQNGVVQCKLCHKTYAFHHEFVDKIKRFSKLIEAVRDVKDILGDVNVAVTVAKGKEVKIPYRLLLTRMNTLITLKMDNEEIDFKFRVEPLNEQELVK